MGENASPKNGEVVNKTEFLWSEDQVSTDFVMQGDNYAQVDYANFEQLSVELRQVPIMVDNRPPAGASPPGAAPPAANGVPPSEPQVQNNQIIQGGGGEAMGHAQGGGAGGSSRANTPAAPPAYTALYTGANVGQGGYAGVGVGAAGACRPMVWCAPPPSAHLPPGVNPHPMKSVQANGADLPMNDVSTLRYYFNLGVDCMWAAYCQPQLRPYAARDLAGEMQQMSLQERHVNSSCSIESTHKQQGKGPHDKSGGAQGKGGGQRPLLGPRFKRGNGTEQNFNQNQNKVHNNGNKGNNYRRNSQPDMRNSHGYSAPPLPGPAPPSEGECPPDAHLMGLPYVPYAHPALYSVPYYTLDPDTAMMGMMGNMGYVGYDETVEYAPPMHTFFGPPGPLAPPYPPPPLSHPMPAQIEHK